MTLAHSVINRNQDVLIVVNKTARQIIIDNWDDEKIKIHEAEKRYLDGLTIEEKTFMWEHRDEYVSKYDILEKLEEYVNTPITISTDDSHTCDGIITKVTHDSVIFKTKEQATQILVDKITEIKTRVV